MIIYLSCFRTNYLKFRISELELLTLIKFDKRVLAKLRFVSRRGLTSTIIQNRSKDKKNDLTRNIGVSIHSHGLKMMDRLVPLEYNYLLNALYFFSQNENLLTWIFINY